MSKHLLILPILALSLFASPLSYGEDGVKAQGKTEEVTRKGFVYIISNPKSFGDNVYKIGMTQRKNPAKRIKELSDSSVPFDFVVNILITTEDPRGLERALHEELKAYRMNPNKEFFKVDLETIKEAIAKHKK